VLGAKGQGQYCIGIDGLAQLVTSIPQVGDHADIVRGLAKYVCTSLQSGKAVKSAPLSTAWAISDRDRALKETKVFEASILALKETINTQSARIHTLLATVRGKQVNQILVIVTDGAVPEYVLWQIVHCRSLRTLESMHLGIVKTRNAKKSQKSLELKKQEQSLLQRRTIKALTQSIREMKPKLKKKVTYSNHHRCNHNTQGADDYRRAYNKLLHTRFVLNQKGIGLSQATLGENALQLHWEHTSQHNTT
jgi:hypothetical protein